MPCKGALTGLLRVTWNFTWCARGGHWILAHASSSSQKPGPRPFCFQLSDGILATSAAGSLLLFNHEQLIALPRSSKRVCLFWRVPVSGWLLRDTQRNITILGDSPNKDTPKQRQGFPSPPSVYTNMYACKCMYVYIYIYICVHLWMHLNLYSYIICIYIYICIHFVDEST